MKQRSKVIATSIATIAMCASLAVGGTFALFTSESEVNVAVTSGTVDVKAYADKATLNYTSSLGETLAESSATIVDNVVKIDKIVPGDTISFDLVIENYSNVTVQYQTVLSLLDGVDLFTGLQIQVDEKVYDGMTAYSNWTELNPIAGENKEFERIPVTITLPESAGNEYQNKTAEISFVVQAVQGNAAVEQPASDENTLYVYSENDMKLFAYSVNKGNNFSGKTVKLMSDVDLENEAWTPIGNSVNKFQGTFDGNGKTVSNLYVEGENGLGLFGYVYPGAYIHDLTIDGAYVSGEDYLGAVVGTGYFSKNGVQNCVVKNAEIVATPYLTNNGVYDGGAKAGVVAGYVINGNVCGNSAIDSSVSAYRDLGGIVGMMSGEDRAIVAENNSVENVTLTYVASPNGAYDGNKVNQNMNDIVGRINNATVDKNTANTMTYNMADGLKYKSLENGGLVLSSVGTYALETLNVPDGVTALGNKVLNGNTTIKEVTIPSSLTVFGGTPNEAGTGATGGFFYQSAVEKITLPEGLKEIPAAAFNQAANLKEVNIPSSVETIGINAFAGTGLETLTIPETVTSIGYGAFRDMLNLTTVTIEGDEVYIPDYTFRACASLTTIYMNVNKLTLQTGNMAFTNTSTNNENPNNITIYVTNDQVYNTLTNNAHVKCTVVKVGEIADSDNASNVDNALLAGGSVVLGGDVTYSANDTTASSYAAAGLKVTDGAVLDGNGNTLTVTNANGTWDCAIAAVDGTIKNLTVNGAFRGIFMGGASGDVYIDNVVIDKVCYTFNSDAGNKNYGVYISNSTLNGWTSYSDVHKEVVFDNCNFGKGTGGYQYAFCRPYNASVFKNCTFAEGFEFDTSKTSNIVFENCYYGDTLITAANAATLSKDGTVFFYNGLNGITIDGAKVVIASNQASLETALNNASGETAVVLGSGNYIIPDSAQGKTLKIVGNGETVVATQDDGSYEGCDYSLRGATVTFENVTINTDSSTYTGYAGLKATYNNCTINGTYTLYGESEFNNCTFNVTGDNYYIWTWGAGKATFNGCTFNSDGKAILVYTSSCDVYVNDCIFNDRTNGTGFTKSAIETGADDTVNTKHNVYITNTTVNGFAENDKNVAYQNVVGNKNSLSKENLNVVVDGVDVY